MELIYCLTLVLSLSNLGSSELNYHVGSLDDTRNALLGPSGPEGKRFPAFLLDCFIYRLIFDMNVKKSKKCYLLTEFM